LNALHWVYPAVFLLALLIPGFFLGARWLKRGSRGVYFSNFQVLRRLAATPLQWRPYAANVLRVLALLFLIVTLARPQNPVASQPHAVDSLDILLALDLSDSMQADDIAPTRLAAAKRVLQHFVESRSQDRMGLVAFSGEAFTIMPLTRDHETLVESLRQVDTQTGHVEGTAIGEAILTAINRLLDAQPTGHYQPVIILATDGVNNQGVDPLAAAGVAAEKGMKIYTIALGGDKETMRMTVNDEGRRVPLTNEYGQRLFYEKPDAAVLQRIAAMTHGRYFTAGNAHAFDETLSEIDRLEKHRTLAKDTVHYQELFVWPLLAALFFLMLESVLSRTWLKRLV
jgi:Ca-activated chloride channel family protein